MFKPHFKKFGSTPFRYSHSPMDAEFQNVQVEIDGLVTSRQEVVVVDRSKTYANFKAVDFSIQNQIAVGSYSSARPVMLSSDDLDNNIASVERLNEVINEVITKQNEKDSFTE